MGGEKINTFVVRTRELLFGVLLPFIALMDRFKGHRHCLQQGCPGDSAVAGSGGTAWALCLQLSVVCAAFV